MTVKEIEEKLNSKEFLQFLKSKIGPLISQKSVIRRTPKEIKNEEVHEYFEIEGMETEETIFYDIKGVIAGGAIANLAHEFINNIPAKINDVDFFYYSFKSKSREELTEIGGELYLSTGNDSKFNYDISKVKTNKKENIINIEINYKFKWKDLLDSFDYNCCQIYYDWTTDKIFWTKEFLMFLKTNEIKLAPGFNKGKPITSLLRGKQKSKDLGSKFYLQELVVKTMVEPWVQSIYEKGFEGIRLGTKRLDRVDIQVSSKRFKELKKNKEFFLPFFYFNKNKLEFNLDNGFAWNHFFRELNSVRINKIERDSGFHVGFFVIEEIISKKEVLEKVFNSSKSKLNKFLDLLKIESIPLSTTFKLFLDDKLEQYKKEDLFLIKKMHEHEGLYFASSIILENQDLSWNFSDYISFLRMLKKQPMEIYGIFESLISEMNFYDIKNIKEESFYSDFKNKNLNSIIEKLHIILEEQKSLNKLKNPEVIKPFSKWVSEITDLPSLRYEGQYMKHCVGGYADSIKKGKCLIFHIKTKDQESTLELKLGPELKKGQHKTKLNKKPDILHKKIAERLVSYLNFYAI